MEIAVDARSARRNTLSDALRRSALRAPERTALLFGTRSWSYVELERAAGRVAGALLELGLEPGERVAAYGRNSDAYLLTWLGCLRAGLVHVPANYALTVPELGYILRQSGTAALLYDTELGATVGALGDMPDLRLKGCFEGGSGFDVLAAARDEGSATCGDAPFDEEGLVQLLYTSGTTAAPKGAMMTHRALLAHYASCMLDAAVAGADRSLDALPLYHSAQMHCFMMPHLLTGATSVLIAAPLPEVCLRTIEEQRISSFFAPPTVWISLLRHPDFERRDLSSLRKIYYGASIMPLPVLEELRARLPSARTYNLYGQSEIAPLATVLRPEEHESRPSSAGRPVYNVETRIVDLDMNDAACGVHGEIVHRSPQLMLGYWEKPKETERAFAGGWFHSGDVGWRDEEGYLYVVDRLKDIINTRGVVVSSREVEEALFSHPSVSEVAVIALPDPKWVEAVTAVVVLRAGFAPDEAALLAHARQALAPFKVPKRIIFTEALPRNTAGKLLKRELRAAYG